MTPLASNEAAADPALTPMNISKSLTPKPSSNRSFKAASAPISKRYPLNPPPDSAKASFDERFIVLIPEMISDP